jgi:hypothetical protein
MLAAIAAGCNSDTIHVMQSNYATGPTTEVNMANKLYTPSVALKLCLCQALGRGQQFAADLYNCPTDMSFEQSQDDWSDYCAIQGISVFARYSWLQQLPTFVSAVGGCHSLWLQVWLELLHHRWVLTALAAICCQLHQRAARPPGPAAAPHGSWPTAPVCRCWAAQLPRHHAA